MTKRPDNTSKYPHGYVPPKGFRINPKTGLLETVNHTPGVVYTKNEPKIEKTDIATGLDVYEWYAIDGFATYVVRK